MADLKATFERHSAAAASRKSCVEVLQQTVDHLFHRLKFLSNEADRQLVRAEWKNANDAGSKRHKALRSETSQLLVNVGGLPYAGLTDFLEVGVQLNIASDNIGGWMLQRSMNNFHDRLEVMNERISNPGKETIEAEDIEPDLIAAVEAVIEAEQYAETCATELTSVLLMSAVLLEAFRLEHLSVSAREAMTRLFNGLKSAGAADAEDAFIEDMQKFLIEVLGEELADIIQLNRVKRWVADPLFGVLGRRAFNEKTNRTSQLIYLIDVLVEILERYEAALRNSTKAASKIKGLSASIIYQSQS